jgi:cobalt-zinc-cadmium efflux system protein
VHSGHHHHAGHHHHGHSHAENLGGILKGSTIVTLVFVVAALAAGYYAHSLALISEAWHNFSDALALLLSWLAVWLQARPANSVKTFGYHRAGVLAAFVNAVSLVGISLYIFWESYQRFRAPAPVNAPVMIGLGFAGLAMNGGIAALLYKSSKGDVNIRSSFVHMAGDALGSVGILVGAILIRLTGINAIDPALSVLIAVLILWTSWDIIHESLNILLEGLPRDLTLDDVIKEVRGVGGVIDVHDLHIWTLGPKMLALSCHIRIADIPVSASTEILRQVNHILGEHFQIRHTTIQFEHEVCCDPCVVLAERRT